MRECYIKFPVTMPPSKGFLHTMCERVRGKGQSVTGPRLLEPLGPLHSPLMKDVPSSTQDTIGIGTKQARDGQ